MKRMERHMVRGPLYKHFDLERKNAKQAEARLSQRLQRLEDIRLYHMKLLTREQRQLQKDLQRLQQDIMKKKFSSYFGNGNQKRPEDVLMFTPQGRQKQRVPRANQIRALGTSMTPKICKPKSQMPPSHHSGLKDPIRSQEPPPSQNDRDAFFTEEKPQAQEKDSLSPPKSRDSNKGISVLCQDQEVSTNTIEQGPGSSPAGDSRMSHADETRSLDVNLKPDVLGRDDLFSISIKEAFTLLPEPIQWREKSIFHLEIETSGNSQRWGLSPHSGSQGSGGYCRAP
ncbi:coiled-coil domain-containing protein 190 isoform X2 [Microcebus murinus]|uniref:coiled-coil domain-containing protein 190 isoform X2 n=1 Tax=Microcebus murinus TaxID=30608 RepID=UPI003F6BCB15